LRFEIEELPEELKKHLEGGREKALFISKGLVSLIPEELISLLVYLLHDNDEEIRNNAQKTLSRLPIEIWRESLLKISSQKVLREIYAHIKSDFVKRNIVKNPQTPPDILKEIAKGSDAEALKTLSLNTTLLKRYPEVAEELVKNENLDLPTREYIKELMGISAEEKKLDTPPETQKEEKYVPSEEEKELLKSVTLPKDVLELLQGESLEEIPIPKEFLMEEEDASEEKRERLAKMLATLTASQKIKLAIVGNSEVRKMLLRDPNKLVAITALKSPKTREGEVEEIARSRSVHEDLLVEIGNNRVWLRNYKIRLALVQNPKTPLYISSKLLHTLSEKDIKAIARDKNVPSSLASMAKGMLKKKEEKV
jgi:hypothetical protein